MDLLSARLTELVLTNDPAMHSRLSGLLLAYAFLQQAPPAALWSAANRSLDAEPSTPHSLVHRIKLLWSMALADSGSVPLDAVQDMLALFYQVAASPAGLQGVDVARLLTVLELVADRLPGLIAELKHVDRTLTALEAAAPSAVGLPQLKQALMLFEGLRYVPTRKFLTAYASQLDAVLDSIGAGNGCAQACDAMTTHAKAHRLSTRAASVLPCHRRTTASPQVQPLSVCVLLLMRLSRPSQCPPPRPLPRAPSLPTMHP